MDLLKPFDIRYKEEDIYVSPRKIGVDMVFVLNFPYRRPPLMLTKATRQTGNPFWTTIPEEKDTARQEAALSEAAILGSLITDHYRKLL